MLVGEGSSLAHQQQWWMLYAYLFEYHFCWKLLGPNLFSQVPLLFNDVWPTNFKEIKGFHKRVIDFKFQISKFLNILSVKQ